MFKDKASNGTIYLTEIICYHFGRKIFVKIHIILMIHRHIIYYAVPWVQLHRFYSTGISITKDKESNGTIYT